MDCNTARMLLTFFGRQGSELAAAVLLAVGGIIAVQIQTAPELTLAQIVSEQDGRLKDRADWVDRSLGHHGLSFNPERPFNLYQLEFVGTGEFQGKQVPVLVFNNRAKNAVATVYVVKDTDFKWKDLPRDGATVGGGQYVHQVAVLADRNRSDVGYIVVFTGAGLELFLEEQSSA